MLFFYQKAIDIAVLQTCAELALQGCGSWSYTEVISWTRAAMFTLLELWRIYAPTTCKYEEPYAR